MNVETCEVAMIGMLISPRLSFTKSTHGEFNFLGCHITAQKKISYSSTTISYLDRERVCV
jgi:hypothetical protein